ncbi:hypothetical protein [Shouchella tritolerans]|uniref:hypothetical protein n=1 Tax=Shouchella tritolerans TaxID=2979466 RepID=UPI0021E7AEFE|nr:hypothetical protein [Shouchella tritolerans]
MNETFTIQLTEDEAALTLVCVDMVLRGFDIAESSGHQLSMEDSMLREKLKLYKKQLSSIYYKGEQE